MKKSLKKRFSIVNNTSFVFVIIDREGTGDKVEEDRRQSGRDEVEAM